MYQNPQVGHALARLTSDDYTRFISIWMTQNHATHDVLDCKKKYREKCKERSGYVLPNSMSVILVKSFCVLVLDGEKFMMNLS